MQDGEATWRFIAYANDVLRGARYLPSSTTTCMALHADEGGKYWLLRGNDTSLRLPGGYVQTRVDRRTGLVYRPQRTVARWSV